jgi:hypothetical protein
MSLGSHMLQSRQTVFFQLIELISSTKSAGCSKFVGSTEEFEMNIFAAGLHD